MAGTANSTIAHMDHHPDTVPVPLDLARAVMAYLGNCRYAEIKVLADALGEALVAWEVAERDRLSGQLGLVSIGSDAGNGARPIPSPKATEAAAHTVGRPYRSPPLLNQEFGDG